MSRYIADPNYIEQVYLAIEADSPNESAEEFDPVAVADLANYLAANDYEPFELVNQTYFLYDVIRWTNANR